MQKIEYLRAMGAFTDVLSLVWRSIFDFSASLEVPAAGRITVVRRLSILSRSVLGMAFQFLSLELVGSIR